MPYGAGERPKVNDSRGNFRGSFNGSEQSCRCHTPCTKTLAAGGDAPIKRWPRLGAAQGAVLRQADREPKNLNVWDAWDLGIPSWRVVLGPGYTWDPGIPLRGSIYLCTVTALSARLEQSTDPFGAQAHDLSSSFNDTEAN